MYREYRNERNRLPIVLPEHQLSIFLWEAAASNESVGFWRNTSTMRPTMAGCFASCFRASCSQNSFVAADACAQAVPASTSFA